MSSESEAPQPKKRGGLRLRPDGTIANGGRGKPREAGRKNPDEVAQHRTTIRYGDSLLEKLSKVKQKDEEMTDLIIRLLESGLTLEQALKGLRRKLAVVQDPEENLAQLLRRLILSAIEQSSATDD